MQLYLPLSYTLLNTMMTKLTQWMDKQTNYARYLELHHPYKGLGGVWVCGVGPTAGLVLPSPSGPGPGPF